MSDDHPGTGASGRLRRDDRALSPVVGKSLEIGIVVLLVTLLTTTLYGGVVPDYRATAGSELADRTLARAATETERAVPPNATGGLPANTTDVAVRTEVRLPETIGGRPYRIEVDDGALALSHSAPSIGGETPLALPDRVATVGGAWESDRPATLVVRDNATGVHVRLVIGP